MEEKLKVCHVVLSMQPGGIERLICNLVAAPEMKEIDVTVCCLDETGELAKTVEAAGARVVLLPRKAGSDSGIVFRLADFLRSERFHAVHTHSLDPMFYAGIAGWLAKAPLRIHTQHLNLGVQPYTAKTRLKFRMAARFFTHLVAITKEIDRSIRDLGVPARKRLVIYNGIDEKRFDLQRSPSAEGKTWTIGTLARLAPQKAIHRLIEAFELLLKEHADSRLLILGDGPLRADLEKLSADKGLTGSVKFLGFKHDVRDELKEMDLFAMSSIFEGLPLALLEGMAAGLACVSTDVGGVNEVIEQGKTGIFVPAEDPKALKDAMLEVLRDPVRRDAMGRASRQRVLDLFSLSAMARNYRNLYGEDRPESGLRRFTKRFIFGALPSSLMLWRRASHRDAVALTFDDGPDPAYTPRLLDILRDAGAKGTFFLIGEKVEKHPELLRRILDEGHEVGNHSYSHPHFEKLSWSEAGEEITRTRRLLEAARGDACKLFRPPRGKLCLASTLGAWMKGQSVVMWNIDLKDFRARCAADVLDRLGRSAFSGGDIVLYHGMNDASLDALPKVVEAARANGRRTALISELLA